MSKLYKALWGGLWLLATQLAVAQECRTEAEIPSSTPSAEFIDHRDGTVTHQRTGLMWMKCPLGQSGADCADDGTQETFTWKEALEAADDYRFAGYDDWRLPNIRELLSIIEQRCYSPAINLSVFPGTPNLHFWSSSPSAFASRFVLNVNFYGIGGLDPDLRTNPHRVRLVRSGQ